MAYDLPCAPRYTRLQPNSLTPIYAICRHGTEAYMAVPYTPYIRYILRICVYTPYIGVYEFAYGQGSLFSLFFEVILESLGEGKHNQPLVVHVRLTV